MNEFARLYVVTTVTSIQVPQLQCQQVLEINTVVMYYHWEINAHHLVRSDDRVNLEAVLGILVPERNLAHKPPMRARSASSLRPKTVS